MNEPSSESWRICRFCESPAIGDVVVPGSDFGTVHRSCFNVWDRQQEALELELGLNVGLVDPRICQADQDLEDQFHSDRALAA